MSKQESLIGKVDTIAGLQIEMVLSSFEGYPFPKWIKSRNDEEYMYEWWSVQPYYKDNDKKFLLFTYHKLERRLNAYYDILSGQIDKNSN